MRYLILLAMMLLCLPVRGEAWQVVGGGGGGGGYIADYDFEEAGAPTGFVTNAGTPEYDYTTDPLAGTQSLFVGGKTNGTDTSTNMGYTAASSISQKARFKIKDTGGGSSGSDIILQVFNNTAELAAIYITYATASTFTLRAQSYGGTAANTSGTVSVGTEYLLCWTYTAGTGANAYSSIAAIAWTGSEECPTSGTLFTESTNGTRTNQANKTKFNGEYTSGTDSFDVIFDEVFK